MISIWEILIILLVILVMTGLVAGVVLLVVWLVKRGEAHAPVKPLVQPPPLSTPAAAQRKERKFAFVEECGGMVRVRWGVCCISAFGATLAAALAIELFLAIGGWKSERTLLTALCAGVGSVTAIVLVQLSLARKAQAARNASGTAIPPPAEPTTPSVCPRCGATLPADAPQGLCPRCVLGVGLATHTEATEESGPHGTKVVQPPPEPAEIAKHFPQLEILECLGRGGMGVVYKARQPKLNRLVALKILAPEKGADPKFAERFLREAQALARLNHPNIVTVHDFGEAEGLYYLLMEYVDGMTLRQLLQGQKLAPEEALSIVPKICDALQFAHELGVVHRDIKPENVLVDRQGRVKIADFGIAKIVAADQPRQAITQDQVIGTPHYMAPEQVEKPQLVDHRADIYSLGVVFYEMLTGELPLGKFQPPSKKVQVDVRLDEVVLHALEKEPERRYQHASEVKTAVETIAATPGAPPTAATPAGPPEITPVMIGQYRRHLWVKAGCFFFAAVCFLIAAVSYTVSDNTLAALLSTVATVFFGIAGYRHFAAGQQVGAGAGSGRGRPPQPGVGGGAGGEPVRILRWRDAWPWNWEYIQLYLIAPIVAAGLALPFLLPRLGLRALWIFAAELGGIAFAITYAIVGRQVRRARAKVPRTERDVAECLMFRRPFQSPGVAVMHEDRLELIPIVGLPIMVPLADIVAVKEVRWFNGTRLFFKKGFVVDLANGQRVGVAVAEVFARRWRAKLSRGALPEIPAGAAWGEGSRAAQQGREGPAQPAARSVAGWMFLLGGVWLLLALVVLLGKKVARTEPLMYAFFGLGGYRYPDSYNAVVVLSVVLGLGCVWLGWMGARGGAAWMVRRLSLGLLGASPWLVVMFALVLGRKAVRWEPTMYAFFGVGGWMYPSSYNWLIGACLLLAVASFGVIWLGFQRDCVPGEDEEMIAAAPRPPAAIGVPVRVLGWRDLWPWDTTYIIAFLILPLAGVAILVATGLPQHATKVPWFLGCALLLVAIAAGHAAVGYRVRRLRAALRRPTGEIAECLLYRKPLKTPGLAVLHADRLELIPISGPPMTVPLAHIVGVAEVRWFVAQFLWWKRAFVLELANGRRVGVAVAEPFARRWRSRLSRGALPERPAETGAARETPEADQGRLTVGAAKGWVTAVRWTARVLGTLLLAFYGLFVFGEGLPPIGSQPEGVQLSFVGVGLMLLGLAVGWKLEGAAALLIASGWTVFRIAEGGFGLGAFETPLPVAALYGLCWWATRGRRTHIALAAVAVLVMALTLGRLLCPSSVFVRGVIIDAETTKPIAGAELMLEGSPVKRGEAGPRPNARSRKDGRFDLYVGWYAEEKKVTIAAPGYETLTASLGPRALGQRNVSRAYQLRREEIPTSVQGEAARRKFVRLVVDKEAMTFEGKPTTWEAVGALLDQVSDRTNTVLEFAVTSDQITVQQQNEWFSKCSGLARGHGFAYASFIGIHALGSKGTGGAATTYVTAALAGMDLAVEKIKEAAAKGGLAELADVFNHFNELCDQLQGKNQNRPSTPQDWGTQDVVLFGAISNAVASLEDAAERMRDVARSTRRSKAEQEQLLKESATGFLRQYAGFKELSRN